MTKCLYGMGGTVRDAENDRPLYARIEIPEYDQSFSLVHSHEAHGDFYRFLEEGAYELVISAEGYLSDTLTDVYVFNYEASYVDVALVPVRNLEEPVPTFRLGIYPNPASAYCMVNPEIPEGVPMLMEVFTSGGIKVFEKRLYFDGNGIKINTSGWAGGLYLVRCTSPGARSQGSLVIQ